MNEFKRPNYIAVVGEKIRDKMFNDARIDISKYENKLNLACGTDYLEGWFNLDGCTQIRADMYKDLDDPKLRLSLEDNRFDFIYASHILEHIWFLPQLKKEMIRILKPEGLIFVIVPHYLSVDAWGDDTHCRAFSIASFDDFFWPGCFRYSYAEYDVKAENKNPFDRKWIAVVIKKGERP